MAEMGVQSVANAQIQNPVNAVRTVGKRFSSNPPVGTNSGWHSRDGDTVDLSTVSANGDANSSEAKSSAAVSSPSGETASGSVAPVNSESTLRKAITQMRQEFRKQMMATVNASLSEAAASGANPAATSASASIIITAQVDSTQEMGTATGTQATPTDPQNSASASDPYWNAENTSDRIVNFAMQFAAAHNADSQGFAQTIVDAVKTGFQEAHDATGDLTGAAGQLNQDTYDLTVKKLQDQLDVWQSTLYNQPTTAQPESTGDAL